MPIYEYKCTECREEIEVFQRLSDDPLTSCKKCGGKLQKVFGNGAGIIFKGSGFYVNDYKKKDISDNTGKGAGSENSGSSKEINSAAS